MVQIPGGGAKMSDFKGNDPIPEGIYHLRCDKATFKQTGPGSKTPGSPMIEAQLTVFGPAEAEEFHGRKVFENLLLSGEGSFKTKSFLEAAGKDASFTLEDTDQVLGLEVSALVVIQPKSDKYEARNQVKKFLPLS